MERATVRRGVIVVCAALTQLAAGGLRAPAGAQTSEVETDRMAGDSRFATSALIAQRSFPGGTEVVYLARGDAFADALAAGTLSDDPILLASPCGALPEVIRGEIDRLAPYRVVALGGEGAVCEDLLQQAAAGRESTRLAGGSRFETAAVIADIAFPEGAATVYLANGADSPDAVAGGALTDGPILLLPPDGSLLHVVTAAIERLDPERVVALGGPVVVTDAQLQGAAGGRPTDRLFGADRFATAVAIARDAHGTTAATIYLARAELFADAVAAGSLADGPVLLVPTCGDLPAAVAHHLANAAADRVFALGGPLAVCDELLDAAAQRLTPVTRAGTIVFERFREDERLDRTLGELWAMDADGGNVRLLAAPDLEGPVEEPGDIQRDISYTRPSLIGPNATDVVFSGPAIWFASTPVPCPPAPYICPVHVGFGVSGVLRWRDGVVTRETPEPEFCVGCSSFFTHPTRTADGGWVAWCEHYQGAFLDYTNDRAVGRPTGLWQFTDRKPCLPVQDALGPIRGHPQDPDTVAYLACTTDDGAHGVWVSDAAGERPRRVADVRVDDAAHDEGLGAWRGPTTAICWSGAWTPPRSRTPGSTASIRRVPPRSRSRCWCWCCASRSGSCSAPPCRWATGCCSTPGTWATTRPTLGTTPGPCGRCPPTARDAASPMTRPA